MEVISAESDRSSRSVSIDHGFVERTNSSNESDSVFPSESGTSGSVNVDESSDSSPSPSPSVSNRSGSVKNSFSSRPSDNPSPSLSVANGLVPNRNSMPSRRPSKSRSRILGEGSAESIHRSRSVSISFGAVPRPNSLKPSPTPSRSVSSYRGGEDHNDPNATGLSSAASEIPSPSASKTVGPLETASP